MFKNKEVSTYRKNPLILGKDFLGLVLLFSCFFSSPSFVFAQEGIFSLFGTKTSAKTVIAQDHNSQTLPVLDPTIGPARQNKATDHPEGIEDDAFVSHTGPLGTEADTLDQPTTDEISVYVVREGDTLAQVAKMFNVSVNTVRWANDLDKNAKLKPGTTLVILPITGVSYKVKKGDTIAKIAKNFSADELDIERFNGISDNSDLVVGDKIIIPDGEVKDTPKKVTSSKRGTSKYIPGSSGPEVSGYFIRPVRGCPKTQGLHGHNGIDIGCPIGTPVLASATGTVIIARSSGFNGGYGKYVVILHSNGTQTLYGHLNDVQVVTGQTIGQGEQLGTIGNTGRSTGPHLHFEIRGAKNPF